MDPPGDRCGALLLEAVMPDQLTIRVHSRMAWWFRPTMWTLIQLARVGVLNRIWVIKTCTKLGRRALKITVPRMVVK